MMLHEQVFDAGSAIAHGKAHSPMTSTGFGAKLQKVSELLQQGHTDIEGIASARLLVRDITCIIGASRSS